MGVSLELINHDNLFRSLSNPPVIVNEFNLSSQVEKEQLNDLIYTRYEGDSLDVLPSCDCGHLVGEYNVGIICPECRQVCAPVTERPLESLLWIRAPKGVQTLINPNAWVMMAKRFTFNGHNLIEWLCNPDYKTPANPHPPKIEALMKLKIPRGINYFHEHFDEIIDTLFANKLVQDSNKDADLFRAFLKLYRNEIFSKYLPVPSKLAFITETAPTGIFADPTMTPAIDAIRTISAIENSTEDTRLKARERAAVQAVVKLAEYYNTFFSKQLGTKSGWLRKHVFGSRLHFSFRSVISSMSDNHEYDELHMPWSMSVMALKVHLVSKLLKRGFTPNDAIKFLHEHTLVYHPLIDSLFQELINEAPGGGIPVMFQRNPSLVRGSAQRLRITKVKTDPHDNTVSLSVLVLSALNADFDGDALNGIIILDLDMAEKLDRLKPHLYVMDLRSPRTLSSHVKIPAPVVATIGNWLSGGG